MQKRAMCQLPATFRSSNARSGSSKQSCQTRYGAVAILAISVLSLAAAPAIAGACAAEIKRMEAALNALPYPSAHQSTNAQLHRQPTPSSVARSQERAAADEQHDRAALEQARAAAARGDDAACLKALSEARHSLPRR